MKLNKQQKRRIQSNLAEKIQTYDPKNVAIVVSHLGYQLILDHHGKLISADWRKQSSEIACNDRVLIHKIDERHAVVEAILPREKILSKWQGRKTKALASHIDKILIVIAPTPIFQESLIDRYLIAAREANICPALLMNKTDLLTAENREIIYKRLEPYQTLEIPIFFSAVASQPPATEICTWLKGSQTVICGQSGVGKSSLVRALKPDCDIWIQSISSASQLGRHTTTNLRRYPLDENSAIIDTPGVRGFAITHLNRDDILSAFPDITAHAHRCRFNDCDHQNAPNCAVLAALEMGKINPARYQSLLQLLSEMT